MREDDFDFIPLEEAQDRWLSELKFRGITPISSAQALPVEKSQRRITSEPVLAHVSTPSYYSSVCDGISVKSSDTYMASDGNPLKLKIGKDAYFVDTGSVIPTGFDSVLSIKDVQLQSLEEIILECPVTPWRNVRPIGEDMSAREVILAGHRTIGPVEISAMIAGGVRDVLVKKKPRIGVLPIGTHLLPPGSPPQEGKTIDFKSPLLLNMIEEANGEGKILPNVHEKLDDVKEVLKKSIDKYDALFIISGPSWGTKIIKKLLVENGELLVGSITIRPASSTCLGIIDGKPVIGLPEHPVSIYLGFELFGKPLINTMLGVDEALPHRVSAFLGRNIQSQKGYNEFMRVNLGEVGSRLVAYPISRSEAVLMSLVTADGILKIPVNQEHLKKGQKINIELMPHGLNVKHNILMTGTYDICIDILKNHLRKKVSEVSLHATNVGSIEGLRTLKSGLAHISGIHAFDEETGTYNIPCIKTHLPDTPLLLVSLFQRQMGLVVRKGNPKKITMLSDLTRSGIVFVNRNRGSGTRKLFEFQLSRAGVSLSDVKFMQAEARTHISLASIIASGLADAGLSILPAAKAFKLDFIPLFLESFDLVIPKHFLKTFITEVIVEVIRSKEFQDEVSLMGGYDLSTTGKVSYAQGGCLL
ncbi:MAG: substrate-binding domain-containing protein [Vulcanimicrobiota bacterium]